MKRLQAMINNEWKYVFCKNGENSKVTFTNDPKNAITEKYGDGDRILQYFRDHCGSYEFRLI